MKDHELRDNINLEWSKYKILIESLVTEYNVLYPINIYQLRTVFATAAKYGYRNEYCPTPNFPIYEALTSLGWAFGQELRLKETKGE